MRSALVSECSPRRMPACCAAGERRGVVSPPRRCAQTLHHSHAYCQVPERNNLCRDQPLRRGRVDMSDATSAGGRRDGARRAATGGVASDPRRSGHGGRGRVVARATERAG
jgi:hypothetical protein